MVEQDQVTSLIRRAAEAIEQGEPQEFTAALQELERRGWDASALKITVATLSAVEFLPPPVDADAAAALTRRVVQRFEGSLNVIAPVMEAVIRSAAGEHDAIRGVPRDLAQAHSLIAIGHILHEGHATLDEVLADLSYEDDLDGDR
ncbi:hypothetical protein [Jiangella endophytica]|uniref:hypothetical protein n=1 Tax=Jiangella endophytica TaxID=1623398 RepID=UPI000E345EC8|nr:hypothetical protein [Jiangella endophytica]